MSEWKKVKIRDFLKRIKRPIVLQSDKEYKLVTIKLHHKGVELRCCKKGRDIGSKMYEVRRGDFILSGIDARNGAFGIVANELDGAVVTNDFWYFDINEKLIDKLFFLELTSSKWFDEICRLGSDGTTQRIRLQKDKFFTQDIFLPSIAQQRKLSKKLISIKQNRERLDQQFNYQNSHFKLLRQAILQDLIQGKMTEAWRNDNPDVEPAVELLKKIKAEKEKLINEKKIKKEKPLPPVTKEEIPFYLPMGWAWCRLGEIVNMIYGKGLTKTQRHDNGKVLVYGSNGIVGYYDKYLTTKKSIIVGRKGSAGALNISESPSWTTDVAYFIEETNGLDFKFLYHLLNNAKLSDLGKGIKPGLNRDDVYRIVVGLPSYKEQLEIARKVDRLMYKIENLEKEVSSISINADLLIQSVLRETVGK